MKEGGSQGGHRGRGRRLGGNQEYTCCFLSLSLSRSLSVVLLEVATPLPSSYAKFFMQVGN